MPPSGQVAFLLFPGIPVRSRHRSRPRLHPQLLVDPLQVLMNRPRADAKDVGDIAICLSPG